MIFSIVVKQMVVDLWLSHGFHMATDKIMQ